MNLALMVELACVWEATVPKPGNVHPGASFSDMTYDDFVRSAKAIAPVLGNPAGKSVGQLVLESVQATQQTVGKNTNLGIVLLLAPLVKALSAQPYRPGAGPHEGSVPTCNDNTRGFAAEDAPLLPAPHPGGEKGARLLASVLHGLAIEDACLVYQAIRLTQPGGMGKVSSQDVSEEPTLTLLEAMGLASDRDLIASQYVTGYRDIWEVLLPAMEERVKLPRDLQLGRSFVLSPDSTSHSSRILSRAIQQTFLVSLATLGDTLIARKCGPEVAKEAQARAQAVLAGQQTMEELDSWLRADGHRRNPGTTADLVCATLFLVFVNGLLPPLMSNTTVA